MATSTTAATIVTTSPVITTSSTFNKSIDGKVVQAQGQTLLAVTQPQKEPFRQNVQMVNGAVAVSQPNQQQVRVSIIFEKLYTV